MKTAFAAGLAAALLIGPVAAMAGDPGDTGKSERAMTPESSKAGGSPDAKSERAMDPAAGKPGMAPEGHSERAMAPEKK